MVSRSIGAASLSFKTGSFGTANPAALWEHRFNDKLDAQVSAEYLYTTGRYKFSYRKFDGYDTTEVRRNGDVSAVRAEAGLFGRIQNGGWRAKIYYYDSERGYPGASVREEPGKFRHEDRQWDRNLFAQGSLRKHFGKRYSLMVNAKYAYDFLHYLSDPREDVSTMYVDNRYHQQEGYLSVANELRIKDWWRASLSADVQLNTLTADLTDFAYPTRLTVLGAAATAIDFERFKMQASLLYTFIHVQTRFLSQLIEGLGLHVAVGATRNFVPLVVGLAVAIRVARHHNDTWLTAATDGCCGVAEGVAQHTKIA